MITQQKKCACTQLTKLNMIEEITITRLFLIASITFFIRNFVTLISILHSTFTSFVRPGCDISTLIGLSVIGNANNSNRILSI